MGTLIKTILIVVVLLVVGIIGLLQFAPVRDPEITNIGDIEGQMDSSNEVEGEFPVFFVSDPRLRNRTEHEMSEKLVDDKQVGLADAPFFIQIADGRWAAGRTDNFGKTPPIFSTKPERYETYFYDEAVERWHKNRPKTDASINW